MLAIDISNYSGDLTAEQVQALKDAGVVRVVVQCVAPGILSHRQQIPVLLAAGLEVEAYVYLWMTDLPGLIERVRWANAELIQFPEVKRLWLDCEDVTEGLTAAQARTAIQTARGEALLPTGIYTADWWWESHTDGWEGCSDLPLWDAHYDGVQALDGGAYGGWTKPAMKQYAGDTTLAGVPNADLDYYEEEPMPITWIQGDSADEIAAVKEAFGALSPTADGENRIGRGEGHIEFDVPADAEAIIAIRKKG